RTRNDRAEVTVGAIEPEAVLLDRAAVRRAPVVRAVHTRRLLERRVLGFGFGVQVVAARPLAGGVQERAAGELVAARARDDVHHRAADVTLSEAAPNRDVDLVHVDR